MSWPPRVKVSNWHSCHLKNSYSFFKTQSRTYLLQEAFCDYHLIPFSKLNKLVREIKRMGCFLQGVSNTQAGEPQDGGLG